MDLKVPVNSSTTGVEESAKLSVIIPTRNEIVSIGQVIEEVKKCADNILVIDGNSDDGTSEAARKLGVTVIMQNGNGKGAALREAFDYIDGDIIVMIDGDGSMRPSEIPLLIDAITSGADLAKGSRFLPGGGSEDITLVRKFGNLFFLRLVNLFWSTKYTDLCYGLEAFRKSALKELCPCLKSKNFDIETEILIKAKKLGLKVVEVPSVELQRCHGKSHLNTLRDGFQILLRIVSEIIKRH